MISHADPKSITRIQAAGFRSIKHLDLQPGPITVLIGPNGAGKSNLLSLLRLIPLMRTQSLRAFVGGAGGASALLHYGPKTTEAIDLRVEFGDESGPYAYHARLGHAAGDALVFLDEQVEAAGASRSLGVGHAESRLAEAAKAPGPSPEKRVNWWISRMSFFHFHDTSARSTLRQLSHSADDRSLHSDGSNLAAYLFYLSNSEQPDDIAAWRRIRRLLQQVAPYVKALDPVLVNPRSPEKSSVRLTWVDERDYRFDVADFSDGTLRALALITALAQPAENLPAFICIDEPELGLHPAAVTLFVGLVRSVAPRCQVLLATQSPSLLDHFDPEEVVVTERRGGESSFRRLDAEALASWLEDYTLSQLYDKNVLGGRP